VSIFFRPIMSEGALPLHRAWNLWLSRWKGNATVQLKARFDTIQGFWEILGQHPISKLKDKQHFHIFQEGISPLWEDPCNALGGHFKITARTNDVLVAVWKSILLHMIGEQFPTDVAVNGVSFIFHLVGDSIMKVWVPTVDKDICDKMKTFLEDVVEKSCHQMQRIIFVPHKLVLGSTKRPVTLRPPRGDAVLRPHQLPLQGPHPSAQKTSVLQPPSSSSLPNLIADDSGSSLSGSDYMDLSSASFTSINSTPVTLQPVVCTAANFQSSGRLCNWLC